MNQFVLLIIIYQNLGLKGQFNFDFEIELFHLTNEFILVISEIGEC